MTLSGKNIHEQRCSWCGTDPLYVEYHDTEWGVPVYDSNELFAKLILDGAQAGLSWITILRKKENYYRAFDNFDPYIISNYGQADIDRLMNDSGIVRNRLKINAAIVNARAYLQMEENNEPLSRWLWDHVGGKPVINHFTALSEVPASTPLSVTISKGLQKKGFKFVGPTIIYAFMQAVGMVNDHMTNCPRYRDLRGA